MYLRPESREVVLQVEGVVCQSTVSGDYGVNDFPVIDEVDISNLWNF